MQICEIWLVLTRPWDCFSITISGAVVVKNLGRAPRHSHPCDMVADSAFHHGSQLFDLNGEPGARIPQAEPQLYLINSYNKNDFDLYHVNIMSCVLLTWYQTKITVLNFLWIKGKCVKMFLYKSLFLFVLLLSVLCICNGSEEKSALVQVFELMDVDEDGRVNFQEIYSYLVSNFMVYISQR